MGIVDAEHSQSTRGMKRQRVRNSMWPPRIGRHAHGIDLHPEPAAELRDKAVKIEQAFETGVAVDLLMLSSSDNMGQGPP